MVLWYLGWLSNCSLYSHDHFFEEDCLGDIDFWSNLVEFSGIGHKPYVGQTLLSLRFSLFLTTSVLHGIFKFLGDMKLHFYKIPIYIDYLKDLLTRKFEYIFERYAPYNFTNLQMLHYWITYFFWWIVKAIDTNKCMCAWFGNFFFVYTLY